MCPLTSQYLAGIGRKAGAAPIPSAKLGRPPTAGGWSKGRLESGDNCKVGVGWDEKMNKFTLNSNIIQN